MNFAIPIALFGIIPVALIIVACVRGPAGIIAAYLTGWLLLPSIGGYNLPGLPPYAKRVAVTLAVLLAMAVLRPNVLSSYRPRWFDLPMLVWCLAPFASSIHNGLGVYDGLSEIYGQMMLWGFPYLIGRTAFADSACARVLVIGLFAGGLAYLLPCLWEIRMSPQLHRWVYGEHPSPFHMTQRLGGYRPVVFMKHGIELGMWMAAASLTGLWLWMARDPRRVFGMPIRWTAMGLVVVTIMCRALGGIALLALGMAGLLAARVRPAGRMVLVALVLLTPLYITVRIADLWHGEELVWIAEVIDSERAISLQGRLVGEEAVLDRARQRPLFGWGAHDGGRAQADDGDVVAIDGMWIIYFGKYGLLGVVSLYAAMLLPPLRLFIGLSRHLEVVQSTSAPLAIVLTLFGLDSLLNGFPCPIFVVGLGAVASVPLRASRSAAFARPQASSPKSPLTVDLAPGPVAPAGK